MYIFLLIGDTDIRRMYMKRFVLLLAVLLLMLTTTGCSLMAKTPSDAVSKFLNKYKNNDTVVINELNEFLDQEDLDDDAKEDYREIYLRQYSNMKYEIKDETIDGDTAEVKVQVTVFDYYKTNMTSGDYFTANQADFIDDDGDVDLTKYVAYKINKLLDTTDTVDYTLNITLQKNDGEWEVDPLTSEDLSKIHGTYEY